MSCWATLLAILPEWDCAKTKKKDRVKDPCANIAPVKIWVWCKCYQTRVAVLTGPIYFIVQEPWSS